MSEDTIKYLNPSDVIGKVQTDTSPNRSVSGYGSKLATSWKLRLTDKRWRRVYMVQWSNSGSAYVLVKGKRLFLGSYNPAVEG